ncbi:uncharacterized protein LOC119660870 [Hermetia illucens]|uniref:uncharacterized protein LOC119660870 n=1 Tax=Hermetia illucens TaxID=343691 RepID=UPI0018CC4DF3|nr:uncharacterized protein LOC119660870 [Hermetia illucens]
MVQSGRELLLRLNVPLLEKRLFQLFQAYAIPAALDGGFPYYHLEADYLAVSTAAHHFALITEKGISKCTSMLLAADETRFACEKKVPTIVSAERMCVTSIFAKIVKISLDSKETTLNFIEDYKLSEVLWKCDQKGYSNKQLRSDALHKLRENGSGTNEVYESNWFAYKHLLFLKDVNVPLPTKDSIVEKNAQQGSNTHDIEETIADEGLEEMDTSNSFRKPAADGKITKKRRRNVTTNVSDEREEETYNFMKAVSEMKTMDEYSAFGDYIAHKIRKLKSATLRSIAQNRINNIIFELEISHENDQGLILISSPSTASSSEQYSATPTPEPEPHPSSPIATMQHVNNSVITELLNI